MPVFPMSGVVSEWVNSLPRWIQVCFPNLRKDVTCVYIRGTHITILLATREKVELKVCGHPQTTVCEFSIARKCYTQYVDVARLGTSGWVDH